MSPLRLSRVQGYYVIRVRSQQSRDVVGARKQHRSALAATPIAIRRQSGSKSAWPIPVYHHVLR